MKIVLAKQTFHENNLKIEDVKIFSSDEILDLTNNLKIIYLLNEIQCYFSIIELNFIEFEKQVELDSENLIHLSASPLLPDEELLRKTLINQNRLFINYLSSYRMLIDHIPRLLNSKQREGFKTFTSEIFDNNFEYRFCDQLRNFTQHKNLPITDFCCEAVSNIVKVFFIINIENLLTQDFDWRAETKNELKNYAKIDALSIMTSHYAIIKKIRSFIFELFKADYFFASSYFDKILILFSGDYKLVLFQNDEDVVNLPITMINELKKDFCLRG